MAAQSKLHLPSPVTESFIKRLIRDFADLYLKNRSRLSKAVFLSLIITLAHRVHSAISEQKAAAQGSLPKSRTSLSTKSADGTKRKKVELDREFFKNIFRLLKIVIPGWRSKEFRLLINHSIFLVARTLLSLYVADLDGQLVSSLVRGKGRDFLKGLCWWMLVAIPATFTNSMVCVLFQLRTLIVLTTIFSYHGISLNSPFNIALD
jgi:ATP-binding cassette, subfamily D (ALD), peroxisomal long-chain fatty acid import protein